MDMMCAALGVAGLASYFRFRDSNWTLAVVLAACFGAASLFCHPMGAIMNVAIAAMVLLDWRRIKVGALLAASLPYLIGAAGCLYYIYRAPRRIPGAEQGGFGISHHWVGSNSAQSME